MGILLPSALEAKNLRTTLLGSFSVRAPYLPRPVRTWPCACSARYRMLLDDRERRTKVGNVRHPVVNTSESPLAPAATRKGKG